MGNRITKRIATFLARRRRRWQHSRVITTVGIMHLINQHRCSNGVR